MKCPKCNEGEVVVVYEGVTVEFLLDDIQEDGSILTSEVSDFDYGHDVYGPEFYCNANKSCFLNTDQLIEAQYGKDIV